jgi:raffinose/stachyose/melibiose transport system permease protein
MTTDTDLSTVLATEAAPPVDPTLPRRKPTAVHFFMLLPAVALFTLFITYPALQGVFFSFTNFAGYGDWRWIGLANYVALFTDPAILDAYRFTFLFAVCTTIGTNVIALGLAVVLNSKVRWPNAWKAIYFVPMVLSGLVVAYCFQYLFSQTIPQIVRFGPLGTGILSDPNYAWLGIVFVTIWQSLPGAVIIFLAGLSSVGPDIYEAGELDGAGSWDQFRFLTLPLLAPFVIINTVLGLKGFLGAYDVIVGLTGGGPGTATRSIAMSIVQTLNTSDYAYGSASSVVFAIVTILLSVAQLAIIRLIGRNS